MLIPVLLLLSQAVSQTGGLFETLREHRLADAEMLIVSGADAHARDAHGETPLHLLVNVYGPDSLRIARLLIAKGADAGARDDKGASPLDYAARNASEAFVTLLLDGGAKIDDQNPNTGATPLNEAAYLGHVGVLEILLARGADVATKDRAGLSPIENAVRQNRIAATNLLLAREKNREAATLLLEHAIQGRQAEMAETLLNAGANANARFASGSTALYEAALAGNGTLVSSLIVHGAEVNGRDSESGATALYAAASLDRQEAVAILLLAAADPNLTGKQGLSPLHAARSNNYRIIAERIAASGGR